MQTDFSPETSSGFKNRLRGLAHRNNSLIKEKDRESNKRRRLGEDWEKTWKDKP